MKVKSLLIGVTLSVATASTVASDEGIGTASGKSPLVGSGGQAAVPVVENLNTRQGYWTSERYRKAKPIPLPTAGQALPQTMMDDSVDDQSFQNSTQEQPGVSGSGQPPLLEKPVLEPLERRLYVPDEKRSDAVEPGDRPTRQPRNSPEIRRRRSMWASSVPISAARR